MRELPRVPSVRHRSRWWSADEIEAMACRWRAEIVSKIGEDRRSLAVVVPFGPEGIALFIAITSLPSAPILLGPDPHIWSAAPPLPAGTTVIMPASLAAVAAA